MHVIDGERRAYWEGVVMARADERAGGEPREAPLSGEWAGESVPELLGDLVDGVLAGGSVPDLDESAVYEILCDAFELGYMGAFPDTLSKTYSVCVDCYYVLHNGMDQYVSESVDEDETRERPAGVFPFDVEYVADALAYHLYEDASFSRHACECCGSTLGGDRYEMRVWPDRKNVDVTEVTGAA